MAESTLAPLSTVQPIFPIGGTVLALGVIPGLNTAAYGTPYEIHSLRTAGNLFGNGRFVRGLGELIRQGAPAILAAVVASEDDLESLFGYLVDQHFDILVPVGLTATSSRMQQFGTFAATRGQRANPILVVMPVDTTVGIAELINNPVGASAGQVFTGDPFPSSLGRNFVLTLDQLIINPNIPSAYQADAAPSIAGLIAGLKPTQSPTGQALRGCVPASALYAAGDAQTLAQSGYLTLRQSIRLGLVPYLGVTATNTDPSASNYSPYFHAISTLRAAYIVEITLAGVLRPFVGEPVGQIGGLVEDTMNALQKQGIVLAYDSAVQIAQSAGAIFVNVAILPPFETTWVTVSTRINLP